jgi:hypothetical protein
MDASQLQTRRSGKTSAFPSPGQNPTASQGSTDNDKLFGSFHPSTILQIFQTLLRGNLPTMSDDVATKEWSFNEVFGEKADDKKSSSDDKKESKDDGKGSSDQGQGSKDEKRSK